MPSLLTQIEIINEFMSNIPQGEIKPEITLSNDNKYLQMCWNSNTSVHDEDSFRVVVIVLKSKNIYWTAYRKVSDIVNGGMICRGKWNWLINYIYCNIKDNHKGHV